MKAVETNPNTHVVCFVPGGGAIQTSLGALNVAFYLAIEDAEICSRAIEVADGLETLARALEYIFEKDVTQLDTEIIEFFGLKNIGTKHYTENIEGYKDVDEKFHKLKEIIKDKKTLERLEKFLKHFEKQKERMWENDIVVINAIGLLSLAIYRITTGILWQDTPSDIIEDLKRACINKRAIKATLESLNTQ